MAHPVKLATPAVTVFGPSPPVQVRTPALGLVPMAKVTVVALSPVSVLPLASWTATEALKVPVPVAWMFWPDVGWVVKVKAVAVPAVMLKALALSGTVSTPRWPSTGSRCRSW